ncbi:hypothetical protein THRCLA_01150 [Thraustotheca clavata]|uniref:Secreted protein n=1 Tax=Thraustotheca clavata TaxID=74557 RepID=A0A0A7CLT5_9STRA|nr:secreted protein [Thraustotheca clavata]OQS06830.1 hypothetical protein THRCLA_01150 [Thraustotheca clavata]
MEEFLFKLLCIALLLILNVESACVSRTRKAWDNYSAADKKLFIKAITTAMDRGFYSDFLALHADQMTNQQAHNTCIFLFWHRIFLVGFENMLQSLAPEYACITLPYYDYIQHNLDYISQRCTDIQSCSSILRDLGGSSSTLPAAPLQTIRSYSFPGFRCIASPPLNHFCDGTDCMGCVPRGQWTSTYFNPDLNFNRVKQSIFSGTSMAMVTAAIELSPHDSMHDTLSGAMANLFVSPADPVFYGHHATIDVLLTIYHKCLVDDIGQEAAVVDDQRVFEGCTVGSRAITAASRVFMRSSRLKNIQKFFDGLPMQYGGLIDATKLGNSSYTYELSGLLGTLFTDCKAAGTRQRSSRKLTSAYGHVVHPLSSDDGETFMSWRRAIFDAAMEQKIPNVEDEVEKIMVMLYEFCLPGKVTDYSDAFKKQWGIARVRPSKALLDAIQDGTNPIRISNWTSINEKYYQCPGNK